MRRSKINPKRVLSLDAFRGVVIAGMIIGSSAGSDDAYAWTQHALWNGWTFSDLIFPAFLVIMGVSLAVSLGRRLERGESRPKIVLQAFWRAGVIFTLGIIASAATISPFSVLRIPGVLQRIAVCYLFGSLFFLQSKPRFQLASAVSLLFAYWLLMTQFPVPGCGKGVLTPECSLASYVDRLALGNHLDRGLYDPEGILSTVPALSTTLFGVLAGQWLRSKRSHKHKAAGLLAAGAPMILAGELWGIWFPINKSLWTSSFAVFTGGIALCGLGFCYWLIEVAQWRAWCKPFEVFGRNPLLSYFLSGLVYGLLEWVSMPLGDRSVGNLKLWLNHNYFESWLSAPNAALAFALAYALLCWALMSILYRKRIFLKI